MSYAELHCLTNFSFLRGASHAKELVQRAGELGYAALAITDECSMAGIVRAWEAAKENGLKLIYGAEFRVDGLKLVLLAPDHAGYSEICAVITRGRRASIKGQYKLSRSDFESLKHCLCLWAPQAPCPATAAWLRDHFPDRGWILHERLLAPDDTQRLEQLRDLSFRFNLPIAAAGDVHMHGRERRRLQDTVTAIRLRCTLAEAGQRLYPNGERHLRPVETLKHLYPQDLLDETLKIAARCNFDLKLNYEYPHELVPQGLSAAAHLRQMTEAGMRRRWPQGADDKVKGLVEKELAVIGRMKYEHFFLTVADLVTKARSLGILCQGRGSAANSAVCYCLGVTEVNPSQSEVLFERFISEERGEPPDIDIDFEHERREEVIQYVYEKYGRSRAALAATVISYRPRSAIRDVGKALGLSLDLVDRLAKSLAWWDGKDGFINRLRELGIDPASAPMQRLMQLTGEILGFPRHLSQHVGGFVISHHPLSSLVPVENASMKDRTIIQWDKDDLESLGLLKVDCLALGMLSAIRRAYDLLTQYTGKPFTRDSIPDEEPETYEMICQGRTIGVFQIESRAQMSMLPRLKPRTYYDLVIEVAIVRPGPIQGGMIHPYLRRRQGFEKVEYPSKELEAVLDRTLGVPLFQEQVMQIAVVAAGFTPGEADQVRRSMAAWTRKGGLEHFREKLMAGMAARKYKPEFAEQIYQQVLGFGSYGFPESHSASFALLTYISCWLKRHQPAAFFAALLNAQPLGFYQPAQLVAEARRDGVEVRPADVLHSNWDCTLENKYPQKPALRLGLRQIAGLNEDEGRRIAMVRQQKAIASVDQLAADARLSRRSLRVLADAGAFRSLVADRNQARWRASGVEHLPGFLADKSAVEDEMRLPAAREGENVLADYRTLGLSLDRHPLELLRPKLDRVRCVKAAELIHHRNGEIVRVAGIVTHRQRPGTASGVVFVSLEDETGMSQLVVWNRIVEQYRQPLLGASLMACEGQLQIEQGVVNIVAHRLRDYSDMLGELRTYSRDFH